MIVKLFTNCIIDRSGTNVLKTISPVTLEGYLQDNGESLEINNEYRFFPRLPEDSIVVQLDDTNSVKNWNYMIIDNTYYCFVDYITRDSGQLYRIHYTIDAWHTYASNGKCTFKNATVTVSNKIPSTAQADLIYEDTTSKRTNTIPLHYVKDNTDYRIKDWGMCSVLAFSEGGFCLFFPTNGWGTEQAQPVSAQNISIHTLNALSSAKRMTYASPTNQSIKASGKCTCSGIYAVPKDAVEYIARSNKLVQGTVTSETSDAIFNVGGLKGYFIPLSFKQEESAKAIAVKNYTISLDMEEEKLYWFGTYGKMIPLTYTNRGGNTTKTIQVRFTFSITGVNITAWIDGESYDFTDMFTLTTTYTDEMRNYKTAKIETALKLIGGTLKLAGGFSKVNTPESVGNGVTSYFKGAKQWEGYARSGLTKKRHKLTPSGKKIETAHRGGYDRAIGLRSRDVTPEKTETKYDMNYLKDYGTNAVNLLTNLYMKSRRNYGAIENTTDTIYNSTIGLGVYYLEKEYKDEIVNIINEYGYATDYFVTNLDISPEGDNKFVFYQCDDVSVGKINGYWAEQIESMMCDGVRIYDTPNHYMGGQTRSRPHEASNWIDETITDNIPDFTLAVGTIACHLKIWVGDTLMTNLYIPCERVANSNSASGYAQFCLVVTPTGRVTVYDGYGNGKLYATSYNMTSTMTWSTDRLNGTLGLSSLQYIDDVSLGNNTESLSIHL